MSDMNAEHDGVDVPAGFEPLFRTSPFLDLIGPLFYWKEGDGFVVGLRVLPKHANARGAAHGGLLLTLADVALGYRTAFSQTPPGALTTISMTADFTAAARAVTGSKSTSTFSASASVTRSPTRI